MAEVEDRMVSGITVPPQVLAPKPATAAELPAHGQIAATPVAPPTGATGAVFEESPVTVVVQTPKENVTVQIARGVMFAGIGQFLFIVWNNIPPKGLFFMDWKTVLSAAATGAVTSALGYLMRRVKLFDNNPVDLGLKKREGA